MARDPKIRHLLFCSAGHNARTTEHTVSATKCSVTEVNVEVTVSCINGRDCRASRMPRSLLKRGQDFSTPWDYFYRMNLMKRGLPAMVKHEPPAMKNCFYDMAEQKWRQPTRMRSLIYWKYLPRFSLAVCRSSSIPSTSTT